MNKYFVWEGFERKIEIILEFGVGQPLRLREGIPYPVKVL